MNTRPLTGAESENLAALNSCGFSSVPLFVTATGLRKSILDATEPLREMLVENKIHDFRQQGRGEIFKRIIEVFIHTSTGIRRIPSSFYRPSTKNGDPRFWPHKFREHASPDDVFAVFVSNQELHFINLTQEPLFKAIYEGVLADLGKFFINKRHACETTSQELLSLLRNVASAGPLESICAGDTSIGRSIESALGIPINSSKRPDYKGIELKSGRSRIHGRATRATLFACVPDWDLSKCKSSSEILNKYGYDRSGILKLYCSVSTVKANAQGLILHVEQALRFLHERHSSQLGTNVAVWQLAHLESRLIEKHKETFWIQAKSTFSKGREFFDLKSVIHTKSPNIPQFERMLEDGSISMDHLIKKENGRVKEKGPLFKIQRQKIPELFLGEPKTYLLQ